MTDKTMPTPGPWTYDPDRTGMGSAGGNAYTEVDTPHGTVARIMVEARSPLDGKRRELPDRVNGSLIAAAGTAASEVAEMGYDPIKAVEALPAILDDLRQISEMLESGPPVGNGIEHEQSWRKTIARAIKEKTLPRAAGIEADDG